jgi:hypothetical protein
MAKKIPNEAVKAAISALDHPIPYSEMEAALRAALPHLGPRYGVERLAPLWAYGGPPARTWISKNFPELVDAIRANSGTRGMKDDN